jgi:hypothetical protein
MDKDRAPSHNMWCHLVSISEVALEGPGQDLLAKIVVAELASLVCRWGTEVTPLYARRCCPLTSPWPVAEGPRLTIPAAWFLWIITWNMRVLPRDPGLGPQT